MYRSSKFKKKKKDKEAPQRDESHWELPVEPLVNVLSFGWSEDGRLGYPLEGDGNKLLQLHPRPMGGIRDSWGDPKSINKRDPTQKQYVCMKASASARHTLLLMVNTKREVEREENKSLKTKSIWVTGLNQLGEYCYDVCVYCSVYRGGDDDDDTHTFTSILTGEEQD